MADIANTALYIHEGDAVNAIMCGMAAIPGIGDLASLARKSYNAFKTSKTGIKIMNALKKYKVLEKILKGRCFTVDTFVPTKHGYTTIKEIQKGDKQATISAEDLELINNIISKMNKEQGKNENYFYGKIIEATNKYIIVEPNKEEEVRKSSDKISIGLEENSDVVYIVGTNVKITYDGTVMESYPLQVRAIKIELKSIEKFNGFYGFCIL